MRHELILGGAKSGKSRRAESRAAQWSAQPGRSATLLATAQAGDAEMAARIARHRAERAPSLRTVEAAQGLPALLREHSDPTRLLIVDCLTLWLTQLLMPLQGPALDEAAWQAEQQALLDALQAAPGPVLLVSNEIGLGLLPLGREARQCVDRLGLLHQALARHCERVTLMVAGLPLSLKEPAR